MDFTRKLTDLAGQRADKVTAAETALDKGDKTAYDAAMADVTDLDSQIKDVKDLQAAQAAAPAAPAIIHKTTDAQDKAEARMSDLKAGKGVVFDNAEVMAAFGVKPMTDATTLATGGIIEPQRGGTTIRDRLSPVSSIIDQVSVVDLTGCGAIEEPYVSAEQTAQAGKVSTMAGTARTATDPTFKKAKIAPYEVNVTSFVDRNLSRLSPVAYMDKITAMAMRALRRKIATLILNGDGQATPDMFGIKTAKNTDSEALYATMAVTANGLTADDMMNLYFSYGGDDELGGAAGLALNKRDLKTIGDFRGTNEKKRLFKITPDMANPNTGIIEDGGYIIPYTLSSALTAVTGTSASAAAAIQTMLYGNPLAYELGLFGPYTIRVDESVKAVERELTILGDVMVGGNLVVDNSYVIATIAKT